MEPSIPHLHTCTPSLCMVQVHSSSSHLHAFTLCMVQMLARPNSSPRDVGSTRASSTFGNSGMAGAMGASGMSNFSAAADWAARGMDGSSESAPGELSGRVSRVSQVSRRLGGEGYGRIVRVRTR